VAFGVGILWFATGEDADADDAISMSSSLPYCKLNRESVVHNSSVKRTVDNRRH
jgi:hypothetical protein